ncbi:putative helicase MOV-10 [Glandiceps talaboti]
MSRTERSEACTKFIAHLRRENLTHIREKERLKEIYNAEIRCPALRCSFSNMFYTLKSKGQARVRNDIVSIRAFRGVQRLAVDQRLALRVHGRQQQRQQQEQQQRQQQGQQQNVQNGAQLEEQRGDDKWRCRNCGVRCNSDISFTEHMESKKHRQQRLIRILKDKRLDLIEDKQDVHTFSQHDSENGVINIVVRKNEEKSINIMIQNKSATNTVKIMRRELLKRCKVLKLSDRYDITRTMQHVKLRPGESYTLVVTCKVKYFNRYRIPVAFEFKSGDNGQPFHIVRFLLVTVRSDITNLLEPVAPYKKPPRVSGYQPSGNVIEGYPLERNEDQRREQMPLKKYEVPGRIRKICNKGDINEKLAELGLEESLLMANYGERFSSLLYIEEIQMEVDIKRYDLCGVTMEKRGRLLRLEVPGLAENRPSVLKGDIIFAQVRTAKGPAGLDKKIYKGYVHNIEMEHVLVGFSMQLMDRFINGMKFDVQFTFNRLPLRVQHRALQSVKSGAGQNPNLEPVLFPIRSSICQMSPLKPLSDNIRMYDRKLQSNTEQVAAVKHILAGTSRPAPYLLFGPPGTGKTVTMVESIKQVYDCLPNSFILACAPSNSAADLIAHRLLKATPVAKSTILRLCGLSRQYILVDHFLKESKVCNYNEDEDVVFPSKEDIMKKRIIVATLVTAGRLVSAGVPKDHFTHLFIDESGYSMEPESVISVAGLLDRNNAKGGQLVLAGDPKQLGPVLRSPLAIKYGLAKSLLERLMEDSKVYKRPYNANILTKLVRNYRSHPEILKIPNELFYDSELQVHAGDQLLWNSLCQWSRLPTQGFPIIFHGVEGLDRREGQSPSFFNMEEAEVVWDYVKDLFEMRGTINIKEENIGIITPYRRQVQKIKKVLRKKNYPYIKVGSVEEFQGEERLILIISTVRSTSEENLRLDIDYQLGFLKNPKRFNVAITRAKALLIVIGNPFMLQRDLHWNTLLQYCHSKKAYRGCEYKEDDEEEVEDLIQRFAAVNISPDVRDERWQVGDGSLVAQYNDPAWRAED